MVDLWFNPQFGNITSLFNHELGNILYRFRDDILTDDHIEALAYNLTLLIHAKFKTLSPRIAKQWLKEVKKRKGPVQDNKERLLDFFWGQVLSSTGIVENLFIPKIYDSEIAIDKVKKLAHTWSTLFKFLNKEDLWVLHVEAAFKSI